MQPMKCMNEELLNLAFILQNFSCQITTMEVGAHMCSAVTNGNHRSPKGKYAKKTNIGIFTFSGKDSLQLMQAVQGGKSVLELNS